jgi:hypothetical protein
VPLIIVCVGAVGIVVLAIVTIQRSRRKSVTIVDDRGNILEEGRMTEAERLRKKEEWDARVRGKAGAPREPVPTEGGRTEPGTPRGTPPRGTSPPREPPPREPPPREPLPREPAVPPRAVGAGLDPNDLVKGDPQIVASALGRPITRGEGETSGWFVGTLDNKHDYALQSVRISVYTYDVNDARRVPDEGICYYVPARGRVRFCVPYRGLSEGQIQKIDARAHGARQALPGVAAWTIEQDEMTGNNDGKEVVITGTVKNPNAFPVKNLKIFYDIYDLEDVQINRNTKTAGKAPTRLAAGGEDLFTIRFNPALEGSSAPLVRKWVVRAWAEK